MFGEMNAMHTAYVAVLHVFDTYLSCTPKPSKVVDDNLFYFPQILYFVPTFLNIFESKVYIFGD